ncbi:aspartyl-tRNA synthetase [Purpureocillium lavendulum]|uniref:Aspartyl-tRNA synthetase n=1 Tax=Purpureocillium lavendulum TaxID=1247861 RepID=A0AB34FEQ8_9HYPO|nr:aspartyl-tRNA synthetase [Purpureocillium lavendulum]
MAVSADFGRVFKVGLVFRAENSNIHRYLTEYTGLNIEMAIQHDYHEVIHVVDDFLKAVFKNVYYLDETLILDFREGIRMLREDGCDIEEDDLPSHDEMRHRQLIREKYNTDYYILDKFPANAWPFYTHKDLKDPRWTHLFDVFIRGQEICSSDAGISGDSLEDYMTAFDLGAPPYASAGLGLERIVTWMLELGDVRYVSFFYRDPKSLPKRSLGLAYPKADTTKPHIASGPPLIEKLIANYGDASNTSWLDERFEIWRHSIGAIVGFVKRGKFAMTTGNLLCD